MIDENLAHLAEKIDDVYNFINSYVLKECESIRDFNDIK